MILSNQSLLQRNGTSIVHSDGAELIAAARDLALLAYGEAEGANGERLVDHVRATQEILAQQKADAVAQAAAWVMADAQIVSIEALKAAFKPFGEQAEQVVAVVQAVRSVLRLREVHRVGRAARDERQAAGSPDQLETLRKMMLAIADDLRVVLVRLASRLQSLRYHALVKVPPPEDVSAETLEVLCPLANRLGLWQLKWELEDLAFRFSEPEQYLRIARALEAKRIERHEAVEGMRNAVAQLLAAAGLEAQVSGRPKHIYSIANKMRSKSLALERIMDLQALRVIVPSVKDCYEVLARLHERWPPVAAEFDDYIARPKPNGYQSLHTVVLPAGKPLEIQIRTWAMHQHAEFGVAAHWAYKEQSTGQGSASAPAADEARLMFARQLLAWQREVGDTLPTPSREHAEAFTYVLTPQARIVELPAGSTPIDFAYSVHTNLGHRCRGARVDGQMVPLNTVLQHGQTVEIVTARGNQEAGPSRDWLNPELGFVRSTRARAKVRHWFNARDQERDAATGRAAIERIMQREGKTAVGFEELAMRLSFSDPAAMFIAMARDELGPRAVEEGLQGERPEPAEEPDSVVLRPATVHRHGDKPAVLVVGVDALMTQLAACCKPVPPDAIAGFVTRGRGVSVHREGCAQFRKLRAEAPERVLATDWGAIPTDGKPRFAADVRVLAYDRSGLLRDVSEVFARSKLNVIAVSTQTKQSVARMQFTVQLSHADALRQALLAIREVKGVHEAVRL